MCDGLPGRSDARRTEPHDQFPRIALLAGEDELGREAFTVARDGRGSDLDGVRLSADDARAGAHDAPVRASVDGVRRVAGEVNGSLDFGGQPVCRDEDRPGRGGAPCAARARRGARGDEGERGEGQQQRKRAPGPGGSESHGRIEGRLHCGQCRGSVTARRARPTPRPTRVGAARRSRRARRGLR